VLLHFGLAKDLYSSDYYRVEGERKLPVRWMAPEALLQGKFTIESDVWAYGVLLHEIMSFGNQPYPGQSNQDVLQFVTAGGRLPKPDNCPQKIYRIMMQCWRKYASERPRFEEICNILDAILEDMHRESYCESESDDGDTLSREGSKRLPSRSPSFKSGFQNLVRTGSKKLRNSLRRHSMLRKEDQATHNTSGKDDSFRESELI
jgi:serine/threonine protein kinase